MRIDYNKIMYIIGIIFIICFGVFILIDYTRYNTLSNVVIIIRAFQFMLPGIILLYLYNQNTFVKATHYVIKSKRLEESFNGYKIAHISDFHNTNSKRSKKIIIKELEKNKPDIIVITGDLIDSRRTNMQTAVEFVKSIIHVAPIYYVLGNHESRLSNIGELEKMLQNIGVIILRNQKIKLQRNTQFIQLVGIDDPTFYVTESEFEPIEVNIDKKIKNVVKDKETFTILLTHRPEYMQIYSSNQLDLAFTGHAHGGQIRIPFIGGVIAPGQGIFPKYTKGIVELNNTKIVISRGIGNSSFPFRVNNRPEVVFLQLNRI